MMFRVGAPGACVEHVSSSLVSYLCLRPFQANGDGMKLNSEIARTKKYFFPPFSVSVSVQTDKKLKKKTEFTQAAITLCTRAEKDTFLKLDTRTRTRLHASAKTDFLNFSKPSVPTKHVSICLA